MDYMNKEKNIKKMIEVSQGYENFIKRQELNADGAGLFNKVLKRAVNKKPKKQRGSK